MVVQAADVTGGMHDRSVPWLDRARRAARFGIKPRPIIGSRTDHVAPSSPKMTSRSVLGIGIGASSMIRQNAFVLSNKLGAPP